MLRSRNLLPVLIGLFVLSTASASEQGALITEGNNGIRAATGQEQLAVCPAYFDTSQTNDYNCQEAQGYSQPPRGGEGEQFYDCYGPGCDAYIVMECGKSGSWGLKSCSGGVFDDVFIGGPSDAQSSLALVSNSLSTSLYAVGVADQTVRQQFGCTGSEPYDACLQRYADTAERQQLQCQSGESTDACRQRRIDETKRQVTDAVEAAHQQARTAIGCQPSETDDQCSVRVANYTVVLGVNTGVTTVNQVLGVIAAAKAQAEAAARATLQCQSGETDDQCAIRVVNETPDTVIRMVVGIVDDLISRAGLGAKYHEIRQQSPQVDTLISHWE